MGVMGQARVGSEETIRCLQDVSLPGPQGEALCLGHKFTVHWFGGPIYLTDDGYVLKVKARDSYYPLDAGRIAELQTSGVLSSPLPGYHIGVGSYLFGYGLWVVVPLGIFL